MFISDATPDPAHAEALRALTALGVELASSIQAAALAAKRAEEKQGLAMAFARVARSVRQSIALDAKLARDAQRTAREVTDETRRTAEAKIARRRKLVKLALERQIWNEADGSEAEVLLDELDDALEGDELAEEFADEPVTARIHRIRADLGLTAQPRDAADAARDRWPQPVPRAAGDTS